MTPERTHVPRPQLDNPDEWTPAPHARPLVWVVCHSCASDDDERERLGVERYCHDTLTRNRVFADVVAMRHRNAGHRVSVAELTKSNHE